MSDLVKECIKNASRYECNSCDSYKYGCCSELEPCEYDNNGESIIKIVDKLFKQLDEANEIFNSITNSEGHLSGYLWLDKIKEYQSKYK